MTTSHDAIMWPWFLRQSQNEAFDFSVRAKNIRNFHATNWEHAAARRKAAFAVRSAGTWNRLPPHIAEAPTVSSFKECLDANWYFFFPDIVWPFPTHCSYVNGLGAQVLLFRPVNLIWFDLNTIHAKITCLRPWMRHRLLTRDLSTLQFLIERKYDLVRRCIRTLFAAWTSKPPYFTVFHSLWMAGWINANKTCCYEKRIRDFFAQD